MSRKMELKIRVDEIEIELEIKFKETDKGIYIAGLDLGGSSENETIEGEHQFFRKEEGGVNGV